jgi:hypothetical protein
VGRWAEAGCGFLHSAAEAATVEMTQFLVGPECGILVGIRRL